VDGRNDQPEGGPPGEGRRLPAAGWYADPAGGGGLRWWDGERWTGRVAAARPRPDRGGRGALLTCSGSNLVWQGWRCWCPFSPCLSWMPAAHRIVALVWSKQAGCGWWVARRWWRPFAGRRSGGRSGLRSSLRPPWRCRLAWWWSGWWGPGCSIRRPAWSAVSEVDQYREQDPPWLHHSQGRLGLRQHRPPRRVSRPGRLGPKILHWGGVVPGWLAGRTQPPPVPVVKVRLVRAGRRRFAGRGGPGCAGNSLRCAARTGWFPG
jgi:hypothetical protein